MSDYTEKVLAHGIARLALEASKFFELAEETDNDGCRQLARANWEAIAAIEKLRDEARTP